MLYFCLTLEPQASFIPPLEVTTNIKTGSLVTLSNCKYHSPYKLIDSYWLKDGLERINSTGSIGSIDLRRKRDLLEQYPNVPEYYVGNLQILNVGIDDQGSYQCVISDGETVVKSEKIFLKLIGKNCCI